MVRWKWVCPVLIAAGLANSAYWQWCIHRTSAVVRSQDKSWPRPWPYPDRWLDRWHAWEYDRAVAETGSFPFHGEWDRLRWRLFLGHIATLLVGGAGVLLLFVKFRKSAQPGAAPDTGRM